MISEVRCFIYLFRNTLYVVNGNRYDEKLPRIDQLRITDVILVVYIQLLIPFVIVCKYMYVWFRIKTNVINWHCDKLLRIRVGTHQILIVKLSTSLHPQTPIGSYLGT